MVSSLDRGVDEALNLDHFVRVFVETAEEGCYFLKRECLNGKIYSIASFPTYEEAVEIIELYLPSIGSQTVPIDQKSEWI